MSEYVTGTAKMFYLKHVANRADEWTYATLFPAIFDYCFPKDFLKRLRAKWSTFTQGKLRVREYVRELELMARKFNEMNERSLILKFWEGLNSELREIMIIMKIDPEINDINDVVYEAEQAEKSRDERHHERNLRSEGDKRTPKREWTQFKNRTSGNKNFRPGEREDKPSQNKSDKVRANAMSPQNASKPPDAPNQNKPHWGQGHIYPVGTW